MDKSAKDKPTGFVLCLCLNLYFKVLVFQPAF